MEKKKMTNKKKFWIGMSSLAAIGAITATVAYFTSSHSFNKDTLKSLGYSVTAQKLLDSEAAKKMYKDQILDAQVSVTNNEDMPVLTRITYNLTDNSGETPTTMSGVELTNENLKPLVPEFYSEAEGNKFGYNESDGYYYYQGILTKSATAKHLKSLSLTGWDENNSSQAFKYKNADGEWVDKKPSGNILGEQSTHTYSGLNKELQVIIETTQATDFKGNVLSADRLTSASAVADAWDKAQ